MIDSVRITQEERLLLLQHYRKTTDLISQRAHTVLLHTDGRSPYEIAEVLYRDEKTVREWIKAFGQRRIASLFPKYLDNQNAAKLTRDQKARIKQALAQPPSDYGIPKNFWDVSALRDYMVAHFGVIYESPQSYHFLFKISNFSFKLPGAFDIHRDDAAVRKRVREIRKVIAPLLKDPSWVVLAGDESRLTWEAVIRRCWLPKGERSILKVEKENVAQSFVGFLDLKSGKPHLFGVPWQNQREIIKVLRRLGKKYLGKKICLVWDNAAFHKGKLVREALKTTLRQFFLLAFPPYAPDTNPQEHVWRWGKDQIANWQHRSLRELSQAFRKVIIGRKYPYRI